MLVVCPVVRGCEGWNWGWLPTGDTYRRWPTTAFYFTPVRNMVCFYGVMVDTALFYKPRQAHTVQPDRTYLLHIYRHKQNDPRVFFSVCTVGAWLSLICSTIKRKAATADQCRTYVRLFFFCGGGGDERGRHNLTFLVGLAQTTSTQSASTIISNFCVFFFVCGVGWVAKQEKRAKVA